MRLLAARTPEPCSRRSCLGWDAMNLNICENLYADGTSAAPYYAYEHDIALTDTDNCDDERKLHLGIEFYPQTGSFPTSFERLRCSSPTTRVSASG